MSMKTPSAVAARKAKAKVKWLAWAKVNVVVPAALHYHSKSHGCERYSLGVRATASASPCGRLTPPRPRYSRTPTA